MDPVANPYRPGAGNPPPILSGRDDLIDSFKITLRRAIAGKPDKSLMPIGLRGVGKTVLLNRYIDEARALDFIVGPGLLEASENGDFPSHLARRMRRIILELDGLAKAKRAIGRALGVLSSFSYTLPDGSSLKLGVNPIQGMGDSGELSEDLGDLFVSAAEAAREVERGIVLAVDEVQYLNSAELGALISAVHRTTQLNLPFVLVGAGLPLLPGLAGNAKSYSERLFSFPEIGRLPADKARIAISQPALDLGVTFTDPALDELVALTEGYPFFIQEWAYEAWNYSQSDDCVDIEDIKSVENRVIEKLDSDFFHVRLDRLTPTEKRYMRAMAELGPGPHRSGDIAQIYGAKVETVAPLRATLTRKGMVYSPAHGDTAFTVPLFDQFLRRKLPL